MSACQNHFFSMNASCVITTGLLFVPFPTSALQLSSNFNDIKYTRRHFCMTVIIVQYYATLHCQS